MDVQSPEIPLWMGEMRAVLRAMHYSLRTETAYLGWAAGFVRFHENRDPSDLGEHQINEFLKHLAVRRNVSASTQNQALCAVIFLYKHVLKRRSGTWS